VGVVGSTLALASVVVGLSVSAAFAGTAKPLPQDPEEIGHPLAVGYGSAAPTKNDSGFVLLSLGGRTVKWGTPGAGSGAVIRYAFVTADTAREGAINCKTLMPIGDKLAQSSLRQADFAADVRRAMDDWSTVANVEFRQVDDPATADLLIGGEKNPRGIAYADVQRGQSENAIMAPITRAAVCFNLDLAWENRFDGDTTTPNVRYVAAHELGHALGLDHAWGSDKLMRFQYEERFYVPQKPDIAGAAFLYGPSARGVALVHPGVVPR
jgi:hypothetical protein